MLYQTVKNPQTVQEIVNWKHMLIYQPEQSEGLQQPLRMTEQKSIMGLKWDYRYTEWCNGKQYSLETAVYG